jgi:hypothetical protein
VPNDTLEGPGIYPYGNSVRPGGGIVPDLVLLSEDFIGFIGFLPGLQTEITTPERQDTPIDNWGFDVEGRV